MSLSATASTCGRRGWLQYQHATSAANRLSTRIAVPNNRIFRFRLGMRQRLVGSIPMKSNSWVMSPACAQHRHFKPVRSIFYGTHPDDSDFRTTPRSHLRRYVFVFFARGERPGDIQLA